MKFGPVAIADAEGAIAAHSVRTGAKVVRKGTVISAADIAALRAAGIAEIVVARLEAGDVAEDEAAAALARAVAGGRIAVEAAFTGRSNLHAENAGVLLVDCAGVERLNRVDEAVTFATLPAYRPVLASEMVGTIKIIPFAVAGEVQRKALAAAKPLLSVAPQIEARGAGIHPASGSCRKGDRKNRACDGGATGADGGGDFVR